MKNIKKILVAGVIGVFVITAAGCGMIAKTPEAIKNASVATVDGVKISKGQLDARMEPVSASFATQYGKDWQNNAQYKTSFEDQKKQMRDTMVDELVTISQAKAKKVYPTDKEVSAEVKTQYDNYVKQAGGGDEKKFAETLTQYGYTKDSFMASLNQNVTVNKSMDGLLKDLKVDDAKVQAEYAQNKDIKYTTKPGLIHIQHILVAKEDDAKKVVQRLSAGEDFAKVAKEVSTDTSNKDTSGDLGDYYLDDSLNQNKLDATFVKAAMAVPVGKISAPVQTSFGWHVIKVTKRETYPAKPLAEVKDSIQKTLLDTLKNTTFSADIKKWKADLGNKIVLFDKNM